MLRFDLPPVWSNAARLDALRTFTICAAALLGFPYLVPLLIAMGWVRGFFGHHRCLSHRAYSSLLVRAGRAGKKENAGTKMFANKLLLIANSAATALYLLGIPMWAVPVTALLVFSFLEAAFSFCAACWAYAAWHRLRAA